MATTLTRWEPMRDLSVVRDEFDRMLHQLFPRWQENEPVTAGTWSPRLDFEETDDAFVLHVELPGVKSEDIKVSLEDDVLTIDGERSFYEDRKTDRFHRIERSYGMFHRALRLPQHARADGVEAIFKDGLLTVTVPKTEEAAPHMIEIKTS